MRFGIIGTGRIARRFIPECLAVPGTEICAVFNPHEGRAETFIESVFNGHDNSSGYHDNSSEAAVIPEAVSDTDRLWDKVDSVYIASPHETHFSYITEALEHGKHVLCEKPLVLSEEEAKKAFRLADSRDLILMEGIKTAYCPGYKKVLELCKSGIIGDVKYIDACFTKLEKENSRELTDTDFGGSFTELGSYVMLPVLDILGCDFGSPTFDSIKNSAGLDIFTKCDISYPDALASLSCGLGVKSEGRLLIGGTLGFILVKAPWWKTSHIEVHFEDPSKVQKYEVTFERDGLRYEIGEFVKAANEGLDVIKGDASKRSVCMAAVMDKFLSGRQGSASEGSYR